MYIRASEGLGQPVPPACKPEPGEVTASHTAAGILTKDVEITDKGVLVTDFGIDSRRLKPGAKSELASLIHQLETDPSITEIKIHGFSDCIGPGDAPYHKWLRTERALRVRDLLGPVARSRVKFVGPAPLGTFVGPNTDRPGRARNRSVLIEFRREITVEPETVTARCRPPPPAPAVMKSVGEWRELADKVFINYQRQVPGRLTDFDAKELNRRVTSSYAEMYLSRPSVFKWAGMAAFASAEVGRGMGQAWQLGFGDWGLSAGGTLLVWVGGLVKTGKSVGPMLGKKLFWALSGGNRFVWWDIFWQHLAYRDQGIAALIYAHKAGDLSPVVLNAWRNIDNGYRCGDSALIWRGNRELLKHEQEVVLQVQVYDRSRDIWPIISDDVPSPIPEHGVKFTDYVPGGDIGNFKDRWKWIEGSMLPAWMSLETNKPAKVRSLLNALR